MQLRRLGSTGFVIPPLVFGGNVFGWTINEKESFTILDALYDNCLVAIDTAFIQVGQQVIVEENLKLSLEIG